MKGESCSGNSIVVAQGSNLSSGVISGIQAQFDGRVIGVQPTGDGNTQLQIITKDNRVVIVMVDAGGNIISVQE